MVDRYTVQSTLIDSIQFLQIYMCLLWVYFFGHSLESVHSFQLPAFVLEICFGQAIKKLTGLNKIVFVFWTGGSCSDKSFYTYFRVVI